MHSTASVVPGIPESHTKRVRIVESSLQLRNLGKGIPSSFCFNGNKLFFMGSDEKEYKASLYNVTIPSSPSPSSDPVDWHCVLSAQDLERGTEMTKEEELLRERKRTVSVGITSFVFHPQTERFIVPASSFLFVVAPGQEQDVTEVRGSGVRMDPKWSPDGALVSFVRDNNLVAVELHSQKELKLTESGSSTVSCGVPEFVMQEEFDRYTGYWWCPTVSPYQILYVEVDESAVQVFSVAEHEINGKTEDSRYPLAGEKNATSKLCLVEFDESGSSVVRKSLYPSIQERFPWCEYIVRCGWMPNGKGVWAQLLNRNQDSLSLVEFPLSEFKTEEQVKEEVNSIHTVMRKEDSPIWVNVTDLLHVFSDGRVLWCSEESGYRHIYLLNPSTNEVTAVTSGEWQVDGDLLEVDEIKQVVYFMGTRDTPLESHLYVASYAKPSLPVRLTLAGYSHSVTLSIDDKRTLFVSKYSSLQEKPRVEIFMVSYPSDNTTQVDKVLSVKVKSPEVTSIFPVNPPEIFTFINSAGLSILGAIFLPPDMINEVQYPVLQFMYGGPHVQLVVNDYEKMICKFYKFQMYAALGFIVVVIDGRGSTRRGLKFEGALKHSMGTVEVIDQVEGMRYLMQQRPYIDGSRICVTGWSYGGYLSLMCLAQQGQFFKACISGAPVTLWEAYDTGYTERYMGTPQDNPTGYRNGAVITLASQFPEEDGRLLLVHGLKDENVHFCHTSHLIQALVESAKPYELYVYPKERHGIRATPHYVHLETKILSFLSKMAAVNPTPQ